MEAEWIQSRLFWGRKQFVEFITKKNTCLDIYNNKAVLNISQTNEQMRNLLQGDKAFMVGRSGITELRTMLAYETNNRLYNRKNALKKMICKYSGFFARNEDDYELFIELMKDSYKYVDLLGVWSSYMEDYIVGKYCSENVLYAKAQGLEPWYTNLNPWSELLEGKKVLFIHPFEETIHQQETRRDKLFPDMNILPQFELVTLKAVQTLADNNDSRFESWFDALNYMYEEALKIPFDIAIIGCGAYGFPLAAKLKRAGKSTIHLGGATQLFWGIKGRRWDGKPTIASLYNEYWRYPLDINCPTNYKKIEKGCYW